MSAYQFVETYNHNILNIDGCLTGRSNITILDNNGKMVFYYFENGKLVNSKMRR